MILESLKNDHCQSLTNFRDQTENPCDNSNHDIKIPWFEQSLNKIEFGIEEAEVRNSTIIIHQTPDCVYLVFSIH